MSKNAKLPKQQTEGSAGYDLYADIKEEYTIAPFSRCLISTGIAIELPCNNYCAYIYGRSGLGVNNGITLANCVGIIDSDYRGEIKVGLVNNSDTPYHLLPQERIAQMIIAPVVNVQFNEVDKLNQTDRNSGGFGSTGK